MKTGLFLVLSFAAAAFAADPKAVPVKSPDLRQEQVKKLASFTWDLDTHKLRWVVQKGVMVNGEFVPKSEEQFEISPDEAKMAAAGEMRGFSEDEAQSLHQLLDVLSVYCAESVVWWDEGQGAPVGDQSAPHKPVTNSDDKQGDKPVKIDDQKTKPAPKFRVPVGDLVALASRVQ